MGVDVLVGGASPAELEVVRSHFARWDAVFSRFRPDSELNRVNACRTRAVAVSPLFARVTRTVLEVAAARDRIVDPPLGLAIEAAGYDRDFAAIAERNEPAVEAPRGCWRSVQAGERVVVRPPGVELDLNGVVKGLAADAALGLLAGAGFVAVGGDVAADGPVDVALPAAAPSGSLQEGSRQAGRRSATDAVQAPRSTI